MVLLAGSVLHYPLYVRDPCPSRMITMVDSSWSSVDIENLNDPRDIEWKINHRAANVFLDDYNDKVTIKVARDSKEEKVYSAAFWRTADFRDGGAYQVI